MQIKSIVVVIIICGVILMAGYRLAETEIEVAAAAPAPVLVNKAPLSSQATTVDAVIAREGQPAALPVRVFEDEVFGYHLSYPAGWSKTELSDSVVAFQSPDGTTRVKVEVASVLPADGLAGFVERSLGPDILLTRQSLTIHGLPAERLQVFSDQARGQVTYFFITNDNLVYLVTGFGEQKAIEAVARSFNAPQYLALR